MAGKRGRRGRGKGDGYEEGRRDRANYGGQRRSEMSEGLDGRRSILGEVGGRY